MTSVELRTDRVIVRGSTADSAHRMAALARAAVRPMGETLTLLAQSPGDDITPRIRVYYRETHMAELNRLRDISRHAE